MSDPVLRNWRSSLQSKKHAQMSLSMSVSISVSIHRNMSIYIYTHKIYISLARSLSLSLRLSNTYLLTLYLSIYQSQPERMFCRHVCISTSVSLSLSSHTMPQKPPEPATCLPWAASRGQIRSLLCFRFTSLGLREV